MPQMPQVPGMRRLSGCPRCAEPREPGDNFCGACGADLSVPHAPHGGGPAGAADATGTPPLPTDGTAVLRPGGRASDPSPADRQTSGSGYGSDYGFASGSGSGSEGDGAALPPPLPGTRLPDGAAVPPLPDHPPAPPAPPGAPPPPSAPPRPTAQAEWPAPEPAHPAAQEAHRPEDLAGVESAEPHPPHGDESAPGQYAPAPAAPPVPPAQQRHTAPVDPRTADPYELAAAGRHMVDDTPGGVAPVPRQAPAQQPQAAPAPAATPVASASTPATPATPPPVPTPAGTAERRRPDSGAGPPDGLGPYCVACRTGLVDPDGYCENCGHAQPRPRDHLERELDTVAAVSDRGLRHHRNEDAFAVSASAMPDGTPAVIVVVCDGVSSATRPDQASQTASEAANESLLAALPRGTAPRQAMHEAILAAAQAVSSLADTTPGAGRPPHDEDSHASHDDARHQNAPACTIVSAVVASGVLTVGWIGDSRAYWVPDDRTAAAARLTEDDSWAAQMVATGLMSEAEAYADDRAHAITGWLGADAYEIEPHTASFEPESPGVVVVCTDGLWNYAEAAEEMAAALPDDALARPLHCAQSLVGYALDAGGHDNVTVAVLPFPVSPVQPKRGRTA